VLAVGVVSTDYEGFEATLKGAARQQYAPPTAQALESDVSAQPNDPPFVVSARMWLAQPNNVIEMHFDGHG
jgi:hypothetical protein